MKFCVSLSKNTQLGFYFSILVLSLLIHLETLCNAEESKRFTLLHTNDLHSHFRPEKTSLGLGGVARLKTAIDRVRREFPSSLLVDAGDWSDGSIYYTEGAGLEDLRMLDHLGYDIAILGNHDWLNGPDALLGMMNLLQPKVSFLGSNLSFDQYNRQCEMNKWIHPFTIREVNGVKIGFIGLSTYELIYDKYFSPVKIQEPFFLTRKLAFDLKQVTDLVVVISHNSVLANQAILKAAPDADIIVGAHDHQKLIQPLTVQRIGAQPGWILEAGSWGKYLGKADFVIHQKHVELKNYQLIQIDQTIPDNPETLERIEQIESRIATRFGPIFNDQIAESEIELNRTGINNLIGNLITDSYLTRTGSDLAMDSYKFIYGEIHRGKLNTVDIYNTNPSVYDLKTGRNWTLKKLPMKGKHLKLLFNILLFSKQFAPLGMVSVSGLNLVYDPKVSDLNQYYSFTSIIRNLAKWLFSGINTFSPIVQISIQGEPLNEEKLYQVATSSAFIEGIQFFNSVFNNTLPLKELLDVQEENWRVLLDHVRSLSPLNLSKISQGNRLQTLQPDLGIFDHDILWKPIKKTPHGIEGVIQVHVKNYGCLPSPIGSPISGPRIRLLGNKNGIQTNTHPSYEDIGKVQWFDQLHAGESQVFTWDATLKADSGLSSITVRIEGNDSEVNHQNDEVTKWLNEEEVWPTEQLHLNSNLP